ncbi:hypothetical protein GCM10028804_61880 [Larkinella terrae]
MLSRAQNTPDKVCSGNPYEVSEQTVTVSAAGTYQLTISYRSPEKNVHGIVRINGVSQEMTFPQTADFQQVTTKPVVLHAGVNAINLSSGSDGGYVCFNNLSTTLVGPPPNPDNTGAFDELCSGNRYEFRQRTITVPNAGTYQLTINYRAPEKEVEGVLSINGATQAVVFPQTADFKPTTIGSVTLQAGVNVIGLSTGSEGGYLCFNNLTTTAGSAPPIPEQVVNRVSFPEVCSGNQSEIRGRTIKAPGRGLYQVVISYRSPEKTVQGTVYVLATPVTLTFPQTSEYQDINVGVLELYEDSYIGLASGPDGGNLCFNRVSFTKYVFQCHEAEDASGTGTVLSEANASGGKGRGDYRTPSDYLEYTVTDIPVAGQYVLALTYKTAEYPKARIIVNGSESQELLLFPSGGNYVAQTPYVTLKAGTNVIRIEGISDGSFRMDRICIFSVSPAARLTADAPQAEESGLRLSVSPNPSDGPVMVHFYALKDEIVQLQVTNTQGIRQFSRQIKAEGGYQSVPVTIPAGTGSLFFVQLQSGPRSAVQKVLINR